MKRWNNLTVIVSLLMLLLGCGPEPQTRHWPDLGVAVDKIGVTKTLIAECCFRGLVRSIQVGNFLGDSDQELAVIPQTGIYLFDAKTLKKKAHLDFKKPDGDTLWFGISPLLIANKHGFSIAMRGGGYGEVGLLDKSGKQLWKFNSDSLLSPNGMVVDSEGGREPRFYVCEKGAIYRLNVAGFVIWKVAENADYIALTRDKDSGEAGFVTAENRSRILKLWSADGTLLKKIELPFHPDGLAFVRMGDTSGFVVRSGAEIAFLDRSGKHRFTYSYGTVPVLHGPNAVLVRLLPGQPPVLVLRSQSRSATGKSVLTVLSLDGVHLYQEYMGGGPALGVVPLENEATDRLIVGEGADKLWAYEKVSTKPTADSYVLKSDARGSQ